MSILTEIAASEGKLCFIAWAEADRVAFDADSDEAIAYCALASVPRRPSASSTSHGGCVTGDQRVLRPA